MEKVSLSPKPNRRGLSLNRSASFFSTRVFTKISGHYIIAAHTLRPQCLPLNRLIKGALDAFRIRTVNAFKRNVIGGQVQLLFLVVLLKYVIGNELCRILELNMRHLEMNF